MRTRFSAKKKKRNKNTKQNVCFENKQKIKVVYHHWFIAIRLNSFKLKNISFQITEQLKLWCRNKSTVKAKTVVYESGLPFKLTKKWELLTRLTIRPGLVGTVPFFRSCPGVPPEVKTFFFLENTMISGRKVGNRGKWFFKDEFFFLTNVPIYHFENMVYLLLTKRNKELVFFNDLCVQLKI